jgi:hypothetical protein
MQQDLFLQRDELARSHGLGEFKKDYTLPSGKLPFVLLGIFSILFLIGVMISAVVSSFGPHGFSWVKPIAVVVVLVPFLLVFFLILGWVYYNNRNLHVYLYTGGLFYHLRDKKRVVRWEQIRKVSIATRGRYISIDVKDEPSFGFPSIEDLGPTIQREVDNLRSSG